MRFNVSGKTEEDRRNRNVILMLIFIMAVWAVKLFPFKFGGWNQITLGFSYRFGFIQRGFLGSVLDLVSTIFHIPLKYMRYIYGILTMGIFTLLVLFGAYKGISKKETDSTTRSFFVCMAVFFFAGPGWNTNYDNFALTDVWLLLMSVLGTYFVAKGKHLWIAVVAAVIGVLIHSGYVFLYFNLILVMFVYKIWLEKDTWNKKNFIWLCASFLIVSGLFAYMMFFSQVKSGVTLEDVMNRVAIVVDKPVSEISNHEYLINGTLFRTGDATSGLNIDTQGYWLLFIVIVVMFSPFIYEIYRYWKDAAGSAKGHAKGRSVLYALLPLGALTVIPMYVMKCDYGRWTYAVFFYEFVLIWALNMLGDKHVEAATHSFMDRLNAHKPYYAVLFLYAVISGPIEQNLINSIISNIEQFGWKIIGAI